MKNIETKIAKNGATLYYIDGKRTSREKAMYWQRQNEQTKKYLARIEAEKTFSDAMSEVNTGADAIDAAEVDPAEYAISEEAMQVAINAEWHNADVASGNYSLDINDEYVRFENHSIVYREFFIPYNKARGTIEVWVILTYADDREHHFRAEFNQGRLADKFIADVKALAGDTPCQTFIKYRNNYVKPEWEDPHKYETVGNLEKVRNLTPEWRIYRTEDDDLVETLTVNGEELTFINGAPNHIHSDTYKAGFSYFSCKFYSTDKKYKTIHEEEEFFAIMADRGACTIDNPVPEVDPDEYIITQKAFDAEEIADNTPAKFEVGKTYYDRSACDYDCIFTFKVISRTAKTVTLVVVKKNCNKKGYNKRF